MDRFNPNHDTFPNAAPIGRLARIGATAFILPAMLLLTSSLIHAGPGPQASLASQIATPAASHR